MSFVNTSSPEFIKLLIILVGGILVLVVGFISQRAAIKKKKLEEENMLQAYGKNNSPTSFSSNSSALDEYSNETIKTYILQYKGTYPRNSIKTALINSGNSEIEVERYLSKFF